MQEAGSARNARNTGELAAPSPVSSIIISRLPRGSLPALRLNGSPGMAEIERARR